MAHPVYSTRLRCKLLLFRSNQLPINFHLFVISNAYLCHVNPCYFCLYKWQWPENLAQIARSARLSSPSGVGCLYATFLQIDDQHVSLCHFVQFVWSKYVYCYGSSQISRSFPSFRIVSSVECTTLDVLPKLCMLSLKKEITKKLLLILGLRLIWRCLWGSLIVAGSHSSAPSGDVASPFGLL